MITALAYSILSEQNGSMKKIQTTWLTVILLMVAVIFIKVGTASKSDYNFYSFFSLKPHKILLR